MMVHASVLPATLVKLAMKVSCEHDSVRGHFQTISAFLDGVNINPPLNVTRIHYMGMAWGQATPI